MPTATAPKTALKKLLRQIPEYDPFYNSDEYYFDEEEADRRVEFFPTFLRHFEGPLGGQPYELNPWEVPVVMNLFGWKSKEDGTRRYQEFLAMVARKNNKTLFIAGIGVCVYILDDEPGMQVISAAADADQASKTWKLGKESILADDELSQMVDAYQFSMVKKDDPLAIWKYISGIPKTKHGLNPYCALIDELHVCSVELVEVLQSARGARKQSLFGYITTSDFERPSICNRIHDYAMKVRDKVYTNPRFLPILYQASLDDNWKSPKVWVKANPNMGRSKSLEFMKEECQKAQDDPSYENTFKRLHLNIRTNQERAAISMDKWEACGAGASRAQCAGRRGWGGLDLGATSDLTAFRMRFPNEDGSYDGFGICWIPRERALERERKDQIPYLTWVNQGWIVLTDGNETDYAQVREDIMTVAKHCKIDSIAVDRYFQGAETAQWLTKQGIKVIDFPQSCAAFTAPTLEYLRLINSGLLRHGGDPVLKWNASNLMLYEAKDKDRGCKPSKDKSQNKIDAIVADIMAIGLGMAGKVTNGKSVYATRGAITL